MIRGRCGTSSALIWAENPYRMNDHLQVFGISWKPISWASSSLPSGRIWPSRGCRSPWTIVDATITPPFHEESLSGIGNASGEEEPVFSG